MSYTQLADHNANDIDNTVDNNFAYVPQLHDQIV